MPFGHGSLTRVIAVTAAKEASANRRSLRTWPSPWPLVVSRFGLVDADVHGLLDPGAPRVVDANGNVPQPTRIDDLMLPPVAYGVKVISIGMFLRRTGGEAPVGAVAWRGPMLHRTVQQFLDRRLLRRPRRPPFDMPPGTGDIAISVGQLLPHADVSW
jgi:ATP-binding protein involved in chromosome partitioning